MNNPFKVVCIDDSNKPKEVRQEEWIKKNQTYTVIDARRIHLQKDVIGFKLKEVKLTEASFPYVYYDSRRFEIFDQEKHAHLLKEENIKELVCLV